MPSRVTRILRAPIAGIFLLSALPAAAQTQSAAQEHQALLQEFGGEMGGQLGAMVDTIGGRISAQAGANARINPDFTLLNSPVANAFATGNRRVYITRQLLALMNSEDELAFVLGHEAGHLFANHSRDRQRGSLLGQILTGLAGVVTGSNLATQAVGLLANTQLASFSRSQEYESDQLGVRFMAASGYDPLESTEILETLGEYGAAQARFAGREGDQRAATSWFSTHPTSADRVARARRAAQALPGRRQAASRSRYLQMIDGMLFDDDPRQGVIEGRSFRHPELRLAFDAPQGYGIQNSSTAVGISGAQGQAIFSTQAYDGNLDRFAEQALRRHLGQAQAQTSQARRTTINGIPAVIVSARTRSNSGVADLTVVAYEFSRSQAYYVASLTQGQGAGPFEATFNSVRRLTAQEAAAIRPRVIDVVTVGPRDTVDTLARRMAYSTLQVERFRVLNGLTAGESVRRGQQVKLVVYGNPTTR